MDADTAARWARWARDGEQALARYQPLRDGQFTEADLTQKAGGLVGRLLVWTYRGVFDEGFPYAGEGRWCCDSEEFAWVPSSHLEFIGSPLQGPG